VTVSIGVADSSGSTSSAWDLLKLSDKALYRAKDKGRNRVCN
jgi:diguanylate cyclase (GGDEF)-like protein